MERVEVLPDTAWLGWQLQAFLAASLKNDEELLGWFNERLVWNDPAVVTEMLKNGLFVRIFAPQVLPLQALLTCCTVTRILHASASAPQQLQSYKTEKEDSMHSPSTLLVLANLLEAVCCGIEC